MRRIEERESTERQSPAVQSKDLIPVVYEELKQLAAVKLAREKSIHTLQPTALVHEAFIRLGGSDDDQWDSRAHFFGAAAEAMRRILIDHARAKGRLKRRQSGRRETMFDDVVAAQDCDVDELLALDEALSRLAKIDRVKAQVVKLKFYGGLTIAEVSEVLRISPRTGQRCWAFARAWLYQEMRADDQPDPLTEESEASHTPTSINESHDRPKVDNQSNDSES